jgi:dienelactone hydrolase
MRPWAPLALPLAAALPLALSLSGCYPALRLAPDDSHEVLSRHTLDAPDPGIPGSHAVRTLYYGSGSDRRRAEYRDSVTLRTPTVDASRLVDLGSSAKSRNSYWGFTPKAFPLNARVWYPDGDGPFPLVLIVHGNHDMKDFSDPGYGYLGELLASRGIILASVDMNFINGGIRGENDARGWLLLKHLEAWRTFNDSAGSPLHGRVDMDRISLIGHSRGGEAVGHAAAFNRLSHYPDDARMRFDFGFGIRSIVAIAPVDGQYRPADRYAPVRDVSYLVFHGSHDGDVTSFAGLRQFQRVRFTEAGSGFKSAVYVYRANHGQWNTVWGAHDNGPRSRRILDLRGLLPAEDQRRFGEVYISAFLEATLRDDDRYLPMFRDHRTAANWLPRTMYITRYEDSSFRPVAGFEEDVDVTTGLHGVVITGDSLATWREGGLNLRTTSGTPEFSTQHNHAVTVGWNNRLAGPDTTRMGPPAAYSLTLPEGLAASWQLSPSSSLDFLLMPTEQVPGPRAVPRDTARADSAAAGAAAGAAGRSAARRDRNAPKPPVDLSIEVVDAAGVTASVPLSRYGAIRRPLETRVMRRADLERTRMPSLAETVLQHFSIPLADFVAAAPALDPGTLRIVRFRFDRAPAGTVLIDDVGFSEPRR